MWKIIGTLLSIGLGVAITYWEMVPQTHVPYDTWTMSEEEAYDVAEATLRYQFEQAEKIPQTKRKRWMVMTYGDLASAEFMTRFSDRKNLAIDYPENPKQAEQIALFVIERTKQIDDETMVVTASTVGADPKAVGPTLDDFVVVLTNGKWEVDPTRAVEP